MTAAGAECSRHLPSGAGRRDRLLAASEGLREIELSGDTAAAVGIQDLPKAHGVYECIVEEWASEVRREFRVREHRRHN